MEIHRFDNMIFSPFQSISYEKRSTETLRENLKEVKQDYYQHDCYYVGEEISKR